MNRKSLWLAAVVLWTVAPIAKSEVVESSASSLSIKQVVMVAAPPEKAWQAFVGIDKWWSSEHTWSGSASNLRLEPRAGGCFCETLPKGGSVLHMTVVYVAPNQRMVLSGNLGPLQTAGVAGAMTFEIKAKGSGSELTMVYNIGGAFPGGLSAIAKGVDGVLTEQITRLKRLIETGSADEKKAT